MKKLNIVLALLGVTWLLASCAGNSSFGTDTPNPDQARLLTATEDAPLVTDLIAGAGQGWPGTGVDVGQLEVWNDGANLHVTYVIDADGWYFGDDDLHLYVGTTPPEPPVAPGQFPFKKAPDSGASSCEFILPIVGDYPAHGHDDPVPYDWTGAAVYVAAHGVVCEGVGGEGIPVQGVFATWELVYGATFEHAGWVTLAIQGNNLVVTYNTEPPWTLLETHLYVGFDVPPFAPGQWPYQHSPLPPGTTTDVYTVPLDSIPAGPGDTLYIAIHAVIQSSEGGDAQTAMSWDDENSEQWKTHNWKRYSWFEVPPGGGEYEVCETMWAIDPVLGNDGVPANEPGWFPTFYDFAVKKWGWLFQYLVEIPD